MNLLRRLPQFLFVGLLACLTTHAMGLSPADGLDSPLTWSGSGWTGVANASAPSGGDVARASQAPDASLEAQVSGPAVVTFSWRLLKPDGLGWLSLEIDDREMATLRRAIPWQEVTINLPPGNHHLRFRALGMERVPGAAAEVDAFGVDAGAYLPWIDALGDDPESMWVIAGSGTVQAEERNLGGIDEGHVATVRGTEAADRTSLVRLVEGPARLSGYMNVNGGSFSVRDLDSVETPRREKASSLNSWNSPPIVIGPGLHRIEWVHYHWSRMEDEIDPYPEVFPVGTTARPDDVATLASLTISPLTLDNALPGDLHWTSSGSNPFVSTLAAQDSYPLIRRQVAAIAIERPGPSQDARLSTEITGPAEVTFRTSSWLLLGGRLRISCNGQTKYESGSEGTTGSPTFEVPSGPVRLDLEWLGNDEALYSRRVELTAVDIRRLLPAEAVAALGDPPGVRFYTSNPELWDEFDAAPRTGRCARSRRASSSTFPELIAWVDGPAVLSYWRRANLPEGSSLPFPGISDIFDPGPFTWQSVTLPVAAGAQRLPWYSPRSAIGYFTDAMDYGLDDFTLLPGSGAEAVPLAEALDTPGHDWLSSGGDVTAGNFSQLALDGVDSATLLATSYNEPAWVETSLTGPVLVAIHTNDSTPIITVDGAYPDLGISASTLPGVTWRRSEVLVPPGEHLLRLATNSPSSPMQLDQVEIIEQAEITFDEALDAGGAVLTSGGDRWQARQSPDSVDGDALYAGGKGEGWIATEVSGPALVRFDWRAGSTLSRLTTELDGVEVAVARTYQPWETISLEVPAGTHFLRWVYSNPKGQQGTAAGLNQLSVTPLDGPGLGDALDAPDRQWLVGGTEASWAHQPEIHHDGEDAAYVPATEDQSTGVGSVLQTTVSGPALARFWWRKGGPGLVYVQIDGATVAQLNPENTWEEAVVSIPPGSHILTWTRYKQHYFQPRPELCVDEFRLEGVPTSTGLGEALDAPDLPWRTDPEHPWEVIWRTMPGGTPELALTTPAPSGEDTWIETDVDGPAVLSFLMLAGSSWYDPGDLVVDGIPVLALKGGAWPDDAIPVRWTLGPGSHTVRWQWNGRLGTTYGTPSSERLILDRVEVATGRPDLGELFPPGLGVANTGTHPWTVQPAPNGGFRAESHPIDPDQTSALEMVVPGDTHRELSFRTGWSGLRSNLDGGCFLSTTERWYGIHGLLGFDGETLESVWHLPPGEDHTLRWNSASAEGVIDAFFLDRVHPSVPAFPVAEALGLPGKTFLSTGTGRWHGQSGSTHDGESAVSKSGDGSLITLFTGPGTVRWWWQSEGAPANASARLLLDSGSVLDHNGSFDWEQREVILPWKGTFRLHWRTSGFGDGRLLVDEVSFLESASDPYTQWALQHFVTGGERATMDADPDDDGQSNFMEFAFGSDPGSRRSAYTQNLRIADGQVHLCLTHPGHDTSGVNYDLEFSTDCRDWTRLLRIEGGPSLPDHPVSCALPSEVSGTRGFVRIRLGYSID